MLKRHSTLANEDDIDDWAVTEFGDANLGDVRLTRRLLALARQLANKPAWLVSAIAQSR